MILPDPAQDKKIFSGLLKQRTSLNKHQERTFFLTLEFDEQIPFISGDSFAIYPENSTKDILDFCRVLNIDPYQEFTPQLNIFDFLKKKVALNKWNSKMSAVVFEDGKLPLELKELSPIEILKRVNFDALKAIELISVLSPQMPRYYSIASSPIKNASQIDLLVTLNWFEIDGEIKYGVASSFLCHEAEIGTKIHGFIHSADHFRVPENETPIIMIGPGTGIAPFRAFIQDRIHAHHKKNWLFFGERTRASDFYFEEELSFLADRGDLKLSLAFSRDQEHKIYVQDLLKAQKAQVYQWLQEGAYIYVCGDAKNMAKDVEQALVEILIEYESLDPKEAILRLRQWRKQKRYNLDVY